MNTARVSNMRGPSVSVYVITYNSSETVIETLESIKAQSYQDLELVVSDDCSSDDTVRIVKEWIAANSERFSRTMVLESPVNTGVSANCNRAEQAISGPWAKGIAGDDILSPDCITDFIEYVTKDSDAHYIFGRVQPFGLSDERCSFFSESVFDYSFFGQSPEDQLNRLLTKGNCIPASSLFFNVECQRKLGIKVDERLPMLDDWPRWINLLKAGERFHFIDKVVVKYRLREGSLTTGLKTSALCKMESQMFVHYLFQYQWKHYRSLSLIEKYVFAKSVESEEQLFWKVARGIVVSIRKLTGRATIPAYAEKFFVK